MPNIWYNSWQKHFSKLAPIPTLWGKHADLCADLDISCTFYQNIFNEMTTKSLTNGAEDW